MISVKLCNRNVTTDQALVAREGVDDLVVVPAADAVLVARQPPTALGHPPSGKERTGIDPKECRDIIMPTRTMVGRGERLSTVAIAPKIEASSRQGRRNG